MERDPPWKKGIYMQNTYHFFTATSSAERPPTSTVEHMVPWEHRMQLTSMPLDRVLALVSETSVSLLTILKGKQDSKVKMEDPISHHHTQSMQSCKQQWKKGVAVSQK